MAWDWGQGPYPPSGKWGKGGKGAWQLKGAEGGPWGPAWSHAGGWQDHSWAAGRRPGKAAGRGPGKARGPGAFDWAGAVPLDSEPTVLPRASYTYAHKSPAFCDVLCPAWSVRKLQLPADGESVDLSLERGLESLQLEGGGFELTTELAAVLGLQEAGGALAMADDADASAYGALLALKTVRTFRGEKLSELLGSIVSRAEELACSAFGLEPPALLEALDAISSAADPPSELPACVAQVLRANFAPSGRWSFFELWAKLLPADTMHSLQEEGGVLCPRFFLVDLASAPLSPYDVEKAYPLVRQGACLFVGQPPDEIGNFDAMRQGRQLEAALCSHAWLEEDHVLTEVIFPGARAIFSAAPDAVLGDGAEGCAEEPLPAGEDACYEAAGYRLGEDFEAATGSFERCRLWFGEHAPVPPESYVEVKKTTHLKGQAGQFKLLKFWLQAALMGCGTVAVATTDGSADGDVARQVEQHSLQELSQAVEARRVWGSLARMLRHMLAETAGAQGQWTLRVQKARGPRAPVHLSLRRGWQGSLSSGDASSILGRIATFFDAVPVGEAEDRPAVGDAVEGYWPDEDAWLPARVAKAMPDGLLTLEWAEDGSLSDVPPDYVRRPSAVAM
uniref:Decapping nuclease n=1 Tax=Alexandrium monilatum TaxID=311494 RepID=A0A7S4SDP3_9DINO|mmetsp:Transcript_14569/g.43496  ORF Transcript_14569/g.43496 Transcript_14569/m.43496 type:complete len:619 (-) Transcript_14569:67-1923(-)